MVTLSNAGLRCDLDQQGRIIWLENRQSSGGNIIKTPVDLFKAVLHRGGNWEDVAFQDRQSITVSGGGDQARVVVHGMQTRMGLSDIDLTLTLALDGGQLVFGAEIANHSDATLNDFYYPCLGAIDSLGHGRPDLIYPDRGGVKYINVCETLADLDQYDSWQTIAAPYPWWLSMSWMMLTDGDQCLYYGSHDDLFHACTLRAVGSDRRDVTLEVDKMAFVKPGETWQAPAAVVSLYQGSWRQGADIYGQWARQWWQPCQPREWVRDMTGYFLVINKQQFGDELWPYARIPELWERAQAHGFDTLGLFGWYDGGHDNGYPHLEPSASMGGEALLREKIRLVRAAGGRVTLYQNGHLLDPNSRYYQEHGREVEGITRWGTPYQDQYCKYHNSDFLHFFSSKKFLAVCPSVESYHEVLAGTTDDVHDFGADGILIDQIGGIYPMPCFNEKHNHMLNKPSLSYTQGRLKMLRRIRRQADRYADYAFMTETVSDAYSAYPDALHSVGAHPGRPGERVGIGQAGDLPPKCIMMPEPYRYIFPETIITIRNPKPHVAPRTAGYAFVFGFRYELELRYLADLEFICADRQPEWRDKARAISDLRKKYGSFLLRGAFRADEGLDLDNDAVIGAVYADGAVKAIALWNDSDAEQSFQLALEGHSVTGWADVRGEYAGVPASIGAQDVMIVFTAAQ